MGAKSRRVTASCWQLVILILTFVYVRTAESATIAETADIEATNRKNRETICICNNILISISTRFRLHRRFTLQTNIEFNIRLLQLRAHSDTKKYAKLYCATESEPQQFAEHR